MRRADCLSLVSDEEDSPRATSELPFQMDGRVISALWEWVTNRRTGSVTLHFRSGAIQALQEAQDGRGMLAKKLPRRS